MKLRQCFGNAQGQGLTEYGVILAIVVVIAAGIALSALGADGKPLTEGTFGSRLYRLYIDIVTGIVHMEQMLTIP